MYYDESKVNSSHISQKYKMAACVVAAHRSVVPVWEQKRADVRHGWRGGPQLGERHDVLEGDLRLRAHVHQLHVLARAPVAPRYRVPPQHLHHDGVLGTAERLHCLLMAGTGQVLPIHL